MMRKCFGSLVNRHPFWTVGQCIQPLPVRRFANDVVAPKVREMDENEMMDPGVIKGLFEQGVRLISFSKVLCLIVENVANGY